MDIPIPVLAALITVFGALAAVAFKQILDQRGTTKAARRATYPEFVLAMQSYVSLTTNEPRGVRANKASDAARAIPTRLNGVASSEAFVASSAWLRSASAIQIAKMIHETTGNSDPLVARETWASLQQAIKDEIGLQVAFVKIFNKEVR